MNAITLSPFSRQELVGRIAAERQALPADAPQARELDALSWQLDHHEGATLPEIQADVAGKLEDARAERRGGITLQVLGYTTMALGWVVLVAIPIPVLITPVAIGCAECIWGAVEQETGKARAAAEVRFSERLQRLALAPSPHPAA